jgi:hypothetical protein
MVIYRCVSTLSILKKLFCEKNYRENVQQNITLTFNIQVYNGNQETKAHFYNEVKRIYPSTKHRHGQNINIGCEKREY